MTLFWGLSALLIVLALLFVYMPFLWREPENLASDSRSVENIASYNERLADLRASLEAGRITLEQFHEFELELQRNLLADEAEKTESNSGWVVGNKAVWLVVALFIPAVTYGLYQELGSSEDLAISIDIENFQSNPEDQSLETMVARLKSKLKHSPDNVEGWFLLARTYMSMARYQDAVATYEQLLVMSDSDVNVMGQYSQALYFAAGQKITPEVQRWMDNTLSINPNDVTVLGMQGIIAFEQKDYQGAANAWQKILKVLPEDHAERRAIESGIAEAQRRAGVAGESVSSTVEEPVNQTATADIKSLVQVTVSLDSELQNSASPNDTVFILAKAVSGPPMPLAVARKTVADLPLTIQLSDSDAMMQGMTLSTVGQYQVIARVSKSGRPIASSGDLEGIYDAPLSSGEHHKANVVIDTVVR